METLGFTPNFLAEKQVSELGDGNEADDGADEDTETADLDDGRFGLNDPANPTVKAAALMKQAGIEPSGINDPQNGGEIFISTTARILFRKAFPDWAKKVRNAQLNKAIATAFAKGDPVGYFKPRKGSGADVGEIRMYGSTKFIGIVFGSDVRIIAVKGSLPDIGKPVPEAVQTPGDGPAPVQFGPGAEQMKSITDALQTGYNPN